MKILRTTLVLLAGLMLVLNSCASPTATSEHPTASSNAPTGFTTTTIHASAVPSVSSPPLSVRLSFSRLPILNKPVFLTCHVYSKYDAPNSTAQIKLPEGVSFISGNLQWYGDLVKPRAIRFTAQIVYTESGNQTIEATASHIIDDKNSWNARYIITLDFGPYGVPTSTLPDSTLPNGRIDRYAVIETLLEIPPTPKLNEPTTISVTITSPVDVPRVDKHGLEAMVIFSRERYELLDGNTTVPVTIKANEPIHFSLVVSFKQAGTWSVRGFVYELITPNGPLGMYHYSPENTIFFNVID